MFDDALTDLVRSTDSKTNWNHIGPGSEQEAGWSGQSGLEAKGTGSDIRK